MIKRLSELGRKGEGMIRYPGYTLQQLGKSFGICLIV